MKTCGAMMVVIGLLGADSPRPELAIIEQAPLEGKWATEFSESNGVRRPWFKGGGVIWEFSNNILVIGTRGNLNHEGAYLLPEGFGNLDYRTAKVGNNRPAIYRIRDDELTICYSDKPGRPTSFDTQATSYQLLIFRRVR